MKKEKPSQSEEMISQMARDPITPLVRGVLPTIRQVERAATDLGIEMILEPRTPSTMLALFPDTSTLIMRISARS